MIVIREVALVDLPGGTTKTTICQDAIASIATSIGVPIETIAGAIDAIEVGADAMD
jgi:hypothetical protein